MAKTYRIVYQVMFECSVEVPDDCEDEESGEFQDAISDIDIPEGGQNKSVYCENSFDIIEIHEVGSDG